jgi:hypothetical protein
VGNQQMTKPKITTMTARTLTGMLVLALAPATVGCDGHSTALLTTPTVVPSVATPPAATVTGQLWSLTTTLRTATGPQGCAVDLSHMHLGQSSNWLMTIERSGESLHLVVSDIRDPAYRYEYEGTLVADVFAAAIPNPSGAGYCGERGGRVEFSAETHVSGRFSGDGHSLTAEQVDSLRFNTGETLSLRYDWSATAR